MVSALSISWVYAVPRSPGDFQVLRSFSGLFCRWIRQDAARVDCKSYNAPSLRARQIDTPSNPVPGRE